MTVTDSLGVTSPQSTAASVTVNASPTVSIAPVGPFALDVGQIQDVHGYASGGSGTYSLISGTWMVSWLAVIVRVILILLRGLRIR